MKNTTIKVSWLPLLAVTLTIGASCLLSGCSDAESGTKPFVAPTAEQTKQYKEAQIKSIRDNPNIPTDQKQRIIGMYQGQNRSQTMPGAAPDKGK